MKITILGCGTSTGVPVPACSCSVCQSDDPRNNRLRASILVETDSGQKIVVDTSPDFRQQVLRAKLNRVDAVLYTHAHADHILGLDDLRSFNFAQKQVIPCYANLETQQAIERIFDYVFSPDPDYLGGGLAKLKFHQIQHYEEFYVGKDLIQSIPLKHGNMEVLGFRFGNFAYATDCNFISEESRELLRGLDVLILDGLRNEKHSTHFTIEEAIAVARDLGVKRTILTHYTHNIDYAKVSLELPDGVELALDQMEIVL
jgi:phosphoribosyl 1,2-cyclic phosphate phosphodiesterase